MPSESAARASELVTPLGTRWPVEAEHAFARWCAEANWAEDYDAPHGEAFLAGWKAVNAYPMTPVDCLLSELHGELVCGTLDADRFDALLHGFNEEVGA